VCALGVFLLACSEAPPRKRSFMESAAGVRAPVEVPVGLNPLGSLDTCRPETVSAGQKPRVLVSRPEYFTGEASRMISALRESLAHPSEGVPAIEFVLSQGVIAEEGQAVAQGRLCGALIVLWEPGQTKTLALTLPRPTEIPLRDLVQSRLCEFGTRSEQLRILYLTIAGLLSLRENNYARALFYMETARDIDNGCLQLPGGGGAAAP
jgi:hypothetical protein